MRGKIYATIPRKKYHPLPWCGVADAQTTRNMPLFWRSKQDRLGKPDQTVVQARMK
jgi:hypothetical protein